MSQQETQKDPISIVENIDCMVGMARYPDRFFDLAIVDPPYGIDQKLMQGSGFMRFSPSRIGYKEKRWDVAPTSEYFSELFRVSKNQIIWGGNYFNLRPTRGFAIWYKTTCKNHPNFSHCEFAWTSFDKPAKVFEYITGEPGRIHPTQKPLPLYKWLLSIYAKPGDTILDTHLGSQSSRIAAYDMGFNFVGFELDADYYATGNKRFAEHIAQGNLFNDPDLYTTGPEY